MSPVKKITRWIDANKLTIYRQDPAGIYTGPIDPGVNYFVLALEQLGATTEYSCEGHPDGFYLIFNAPLGVALAVHECGFLTVELEGENRWRLCINRSVTETDRRAILSGAALTWTKEFGPVLYTKERKHGPVFEHVS